MKKIKYLIFHIIALVFVTNLLSAQSEYQELINKGFSPGVIVKAGIYPDSNDFKKPNPDFSNKKIEDESNYNIENPKTAEEIVTEHGMKWLERSMDRNDKNAQMTSFTFDPNATNYERFKSSPCFDKIGFSPMKLQTPEAVKALEEIYSDCEYQHVLSKTIKGTFLVIFILVLILTVYLGIGKDKIKSLFFKKNRLT